MGAVAGWILAGGLVVWVCAVLWEAGFPRGLRPWLMRPKNASNALRWLTWVAAGAFAGAAWLAWADDPDSALGSFNTEATGIATAVVLIEEISRWRAYLDRKQEIIQQMGSRSNDFALDAARIAEDEGWLYDGSFQHAKLARASLQGADLSGANLQGAVLMGANLQGAILVGANLQGAKLIATDLEGAFLHKADLQDADLRAAWLKDADLQATSLQGANFLGADLQRTNLIGIVYNTETKWPEDFNLLAHVRDWIAR